MQNKLIVISIDSLQTTDLDYLKEKKNFHWILERASVVKNIREIYPTLTYPIHTTLITGVKPNKHGIYHNQQPSIQQEMPDWSIMGSNWYWYSDHVKVKSLVDAANEKGLKTAAVMWPVMAGEKPNHNLAEIWPNRHEEVHETFKKACTSDVFELYYDSHLKTFDWDHKIDVDGYAIPIAEDMIRRFNPDFMLIHSVCLDHARHVHGVEGEAINQCLDRVDEIIGSLIGASRDAGDFERTNFVILGDHGHIYVENVFNLNVLFKEYGFIRVDADGNVVDFDAFSFSSGFSSQIIMKNSEDEALKSKLHKALLQMQSDYPEYIGRIFSAAEVDREEGLEGNFAFVLEGRDGVMFDNHFNAELILDMKVSRGKKYIGMHGHHPSKGPKPVFISFGPDVIPGITIESGDILDICPTLGKLLNIQEEDMPHMEGKAFELIS
jgi:predicted AlkP superfamily pyrophosphatase or phosphodiesterase